MLSFRNYISCLYNCDDPPSNNEFLSWECVIAEQINFEKNMKRQTDADGKAMEK